MWLWIFLILFFIISVVTSTLLYFSLKRINQYEELILQIQQVIQFSTDKMKLVDSKGHYESDDETGFFFQQLKEIQLLYKETTSNTIWVIDRLNKADLGMANDTFYDRSFSNSKFLTVLGSDELLRLYFDIRIAEDPNDFEPSRKKKIWIKNYSSTN